MDKGVNNKSRHTMDERKHVRWANDWYAYNAIFVWRDFKIKSHYHLSIKACHVYWCSFVWPLAIVICIRNCDFWQQSVHPDILTVTFQCCCHLTFTSMRNKWDKYRIFTLMSSEHTSTQACSCTINSCRINYVEWNISIGLI